MPSEPFIRVKNLSRYYNDVCAVDNISFEVHKGEVLGFLGPNGAGKSTTMRMLTGVLAPSSGEIQIRGVDLLTQPSQAKSHIGYLPEQPPLYADQTVDAYLRYCASLRGIPRLQQQNALDACKARCGLEQAGGRLIANLSKGYQQRVGIAQAIIHSPDIVILDEPTVGLDPIQIREIRQLIRELGGEHSVILSSHILPEIQTTCDRVQIINNGRLVFSESMDVLQAKMESKTLLLGLRQAPKPEDIKAVDAVLAVENGPNGLLRIHFESAKDPTAALARMALDKHWGLYHLAPEQRSLEEIFVEITSQDLAENSQDTKEETAA